MAKLKILFVCTGNSCRSQMAEGWARALRGELIEPYSAGTEPYKLDPMAVAAMREVGVDISHYRPKHVNEVAGVGFDYVVTVCDWARRSCPTFPGATKVEHVNFDDPPALVRDAARNLQEAVTIYRRVRDQIRAFIQTLPGALTQR